MQQATTFDKDTQQKYAKRIVSPLRADDGKISNRAAGNNDLGTIIKAQFDANLRSLTNSFQEQHDKEDRQSKRMIKTQQNSAKKAANAEAGLDFSRKVPEIE